MGNGIGVFLHISTGSARYSNGVLKEVKNKFTLGQERLETSNVRSLKISTVPQWS
jgi:hypothetical protein